MRGKEGEEAAQAATNKARDRRQPHSTPPCGRYREEGARLEAAAAMAGKGREGLRARREEEEMAAGPCPRRGSGVWHRPPRVPRPGASVPEPWSGSVWGRGVAEDLIYLPWEEYK